MKRALLFLFCALMSAQIFAETEFGASFPILAYLQRTTCTYMEGDEQNYTLNTLNFNHDNMCYINDVAYVQHNGFFFREENDKILVYSEPAKKDLVLYDFTLQLGDTLTTVNIDGVSYGDAEMLKFVMVDYPVTVDGNTATIDTLIVTDVSTIVLLDSNEYKKWTFSNGMEYVESIGSLGYDFFPTIKPYPGDLACVPTCCIEYRLVCVSLYDKLRYQMDDKQMELMGMDCPCVSWAGKWANQWNVLASGGMPFEPTARTWQYKLEQDTTINDIKYKAVTRHWTADPTYTEYVAAVRFTENQKVFIYYDNAEYLLYDFDYNLYLGDTLEVFSGTNNYEHFKTLKYVIDNVEQTCGGIAESIVYMNMLDPITEEITGLPLVWEEFVGSHEGFVQGVNQTEGGYAYHLLCAYHNDGLRYSTNYGEFTQYGCEYNTPTAVEDIDMSTSPFSKTLLNGHLVILRDGKTYNVMGVEVGK